MGLHQTLEQINSIYSDSSCKALQEIIDNAISNPKNNFISKNSKEEVVLFDTLKRSLITDVYKLQFNDILEEKEGSIELLSENAITTLTKEFVSLYNEKKDLVTAKSDALHFLHVPFELSKSAKDSTISKYISGLGNENNKFSLIETARKNILNAASKENISEILNGLEKSYMNLSVFKTYGIRTSYINKALSKFEGIHGVHVLPFNKGKLIEGIDKQISNLSFFNRLNPFGLRKTLEKLKEQVNSTSDLSKIEEILNEYSDPLKYTNMFGYFYSIFGYFSSDTRNVIKFISKYAGESYQNLQKSNT